MKISEHAYLSLNRAHAAMVNRAEKAEAQCGELREVLQSAMREIERINNLKDGQPLASHNLLYNLRGIIEKGGAE